MTDSVSCPTHRRIRRLAIVPLFGLVALGAAPAAQAQSSIGNLYNKWQIDLSGAMVLMGSTIRVDGANGEGTDVDSDVLGLSKSRLEPRISVRWRPGHKHELELGYQFARRDAEKTLDREIIFNDSTYDVGANIKTNFRTDQAFLTYRFALKAAERSQLGLGVGIGLLPFKFEIDALGSVNGGEEVTSSGEKSFARPDRLDRRVRAVAPGRAVVRRERPPRHQDQDRPAPCQRRRGEPGGTLLPVSEVRRRPGLRHQLDPAGSGPKG